jgi:hypothetical protein
MLLVSLTNQPWLKCFFLLFAVVALPAGNATMGGFQAMLVSHDKLGRMFAGVGLIQDVLGPAITVSAGWVMQCVGYRAAALMLTALAGAALVICLTMKPLMTLPKPELWQEHIDEYHLERF